MRDKKATFSLLVLSILAFLLLWALSPRLGFLLGTGRLQFILAEGFVTIVWVGLAIAIVRGITALKLTPIANLTGMLVSVFVLLLILAFKGWPPFANLVLIIASSFFGCLLAAIFREPNILLPVALLAPLIDFWTITAGPVRHILDRTPDVLPAVAAGVPGPGQLAPIAFIGMGDFLFMAMFLAAAERLRMNPGKTVWLFFVLVSLTMALLITTDLFGPIGVPGLVVIGLGFIAANIRHFRLSRQEMIITAVLVIAAVVAVIFIGLKG